MQLNEIYAFAHNLLRTKIVYDKIIALCALALLLCWKWLSVERFAHHHARKFEKNLAQQIRWLDSSSWLVYLPLPTHCSIILIVLHIFNVYWPLHIFYIHSLCYAFQASKYFIHFLWQSSIAGKETDITHISRRIKYATIVKTQNVCSFTRFNITIELQIIEHIRMIKNVYAYTTMWKRLHTVNALVNRQT